MVERRDRVEEPEVGGVAERLVVLEPEPQAEHDREGALDDDVDDRDAEQHAPDVAQVERLRLGLGDERGADAEPSAHEQREQGRERGDAEAAELHADEDDHLSDRRECGARVHHGVPGDADRRRRGEQCCAKAHRAVVRTGERAARAAR